jgi:hypothetical protein
MGRSRGAETERDRFWLDHEAAIAASGQTAKAYAAEQGLSLQALCQSRKRHRSMAETSTPVPHRSAARPDPKVVSFSRVELHPPQPSSADFRLSLPNGFVLEWSGPELPQGVMALVERLTMPR